MPDQDDMTKVKETKEEQLVDDAFQHLLDTYLNSRHRKKVDLITKAFNFARQAHKGVKRLSGEPYIMHPIAVAQIACGEMGLGSTSICSALLHDVVEDTDYTVEDIANIFGNKIAQIVDGLTKISGGIFGDQASKQTENFKKLLLTMSDDIRVILIKICDRLHNMRTLDSQPHNKQYKIAGETLYIYAPLANRLGLNKIKTELENLSFKFEHPDEYESISNNLQYTKEGRDKLFDDFTQPIREQLDKMGVSYEIKARVKSPYSIWQKMQNKHVTFNEIYDILAVRIIFTPNNREKEIQECFDIYVALTKIYRSHPQRFRDWLNNPKTNGYKALHVTLMSKQGSWIEVQIRSDHMDEVAEQGFAAHWKYKEGENGEEPEMSEEDGELNNWISTIKEILDDPQPDSMDFLDSIKLNLFASEIFVFTPKGEIKTMPAGCTALDFAFQIHTFIGSHCIGAKVNHKLVPLSHKLQSGDQVEILTSKSQHVHASWLDFVFTAKARSKIQAILRKESREIQKEGENILNEWLKANGLELTTPILDKLCDYHEIQKHENFLFALGKKTIVLNDNDLDEILDKDKKKGWLKYVPFAKGEKKKDKVIPVGRGLLTVGKDFNKKIPCIITEETIGMYVHQNCCHPIPGDDILGFIDNKNHVVLHKRNCPVANKLKSSYGNRILDAKWEMHQQLFFDATIEIRGIDRKGILHDLADVLTDQMDIYIRKITITSDDGIFEGTVEVRIHDRVEVKNIINKIKKIKDVKEVQQII
ncbi:MAG: bifunctional (p)ppGpp synthetase/guanosine-3',5'-bis(diphosphate) 3'-pyrophosphohydrolase [Prevotella sp.]|nr:bifunctional (p)ppGpp synthetase/guanosine-3',5'-bis(diphosphate) 3'-pyrophosphohydrolase [Prevotella sp.]